MSVIKKVVENYINVLKKNNDYVFNIAFSGGKDSTALLLIFFYVLEKMPSLAKKVKFNIIHSNTLMEFPNYEIYVFNTLRNINKYIKEKKLNGDVYIVTPDKKNKFFNLIIGNGQPLPRRDARWCSDRLKIQPQNKFLKKKFKDKKIITFIGSRKEESSDRANRLNNNDLGNALKKNNNDILFAPLEDLSTYDVWKIIHSTKNQNWLNKDELLKLYNVASNNNSKFPSARYGCFVCPLITKDNTFENILKEYPQYKPLYEFREFIVKYQNIWFDKEKNEPVRDVFNHKNHKIYYYSLENKRKNMVMPGGYNLKTRQMFFKKFLESLIKTKQQDKNFPAHLYLTKSDIIYIQEKWLRDGDVYLSAFNLAYKYLKISDLAISDIQLKLNHNFLLLLTEKDLILNYSFKNNNLNYLRTYLKMIDVFFNKKEIKEKLDNGFNIEKIEKLTADFLQSKKDIYEQLLKDKYYVGNEAFEELIYKTWKEDTPDYFTLLNRFKNNEIEKPKQLSIFEDFTNDAIERFFKIYEENEENEDILESDKLSLEEKYAYLESFRRSYPNR